MKAILLSRPFDFGSLERSWTQHPLMLPVLGIPIILHHAAFLHSIGVKEVRILRADGPQLDEEDSALEAFASRNAPDLAWSSRPWPQKPVADGKTLVEILNLQRIYLAGEESLVFSAPLLFLEPLTGANVPQGFPKSESKILGPLLLQTTGRLVPAQFGPQASLCHPVDFFATQMKLLTSVSPRPLSLKGVHHQAVVSPPVVLGKGVRIAAKSQVGPQSVLADGVQVDTFAKIKRVLVLSRVRFGKGVQLENQIVLGNKIISVEHGTVTEISDKKLLRVL